MEVRELKIGNLVTIHNEKYHPSLKGVPLEVTGISEASEDRWAISLQHINQKRNTFYQTYSQFIKYLAPISLQPEILEAAGFVNSWTGKENKANGFYKRKDCPFQIGYIVQDEFFETEINGQIVILKYVHSLQNLYHSITGSDLKIELPTTGKE